ncbi:MAG: menE, O-succinylbenzoate-CoA ligase [Pseudobdellovibrio sp.]|nr:menE, O-succinylbenzoate-CoA ligase [Pseudobdellovibrio sp.]
MISFQPGAANQLLINPRLSPDEKSVLGELKNAFEINFGKENYFLVPSSGSSKAVNQSVKLMALSIESVLNSAKRVNFYLNATAENDWGLFLPEFHVAGLGVMARAHLAGAKVKPFVFSAKDFSSIIAEHHISFTSLVPAQIFDLAVAGAKAPACIKKVFVGGGFLNSDLRRQVAGLGWPVTETYGMTETASMVALREPRDEHFKIMPGVSAGIENELLKIKCNSLLTAVVQKTAGQISVTAMDSNGWLQTEDLAVLHEKENGAYIELLGRKTDYIKILGEGVSLSELRQKLQALGQQLAIDPRAYELTATEHERAGYQLTLVTEESVQDRSQELIDAYNALCRPYERITRSFVLRQIPRTDLGKLKTAELKRIIESSEA